MFADIRREAPEAQFVQGCSWVYNLPAYRRLFPPEYVSRAVPAEPELQFMASCGQFLDRHGNLRTGAAQTFRERFTGAHTFAEVLGSFPLSALEPRCPIHHFYAFYSG